MVRAGWEFPESPPPQAVAPASTAVAAKPTAAMRSRFACPFLGLHVAPMEQDPSLIAGSAGRFGSWHLLFQVLSLSDSMQVSPNPKDHHCKFESNPAYQ